MKRLLLLVAAVALATAVPACAQQDTRDTEAQQEKARDLDAVTPEEGTTPPAEASFERDEELAAETVMATGVIEKPEVTSYMYGTHAITDEVSGNLYALRSEEEGLLDRYTGRRATVNGTVVPGYESGLEGGPPLLEVNRVDPAATNA